MPRDLFGDVTRPSISLGSRKWYTVPLSLISHSVIVLALVAIPLLATDVLPEPWQKIEVVFPDAPPPPPPPPPIREIKVVPPQAEAVIPFEAPTGFAPEPERPNVDWRETDTPPGVVLGDFDKPESVVVPPPRPVEQPPVRVGGTIRQPQKVRDVPPVYPAIAQAARVEGVVIIEATIGTDGRLINARILRGVPLLDQAAIDAVSQWEFTPTLLNGVPVPVIMTVTVQFKLTR
ncbi:MAG TPA: energy transducer TonB [Vicinamibacterales bacterium]|nr:energy transducer TonB [Vicinamibacterales bacterium]